MDSTQAGHVRRLAGIEHPEPIPQDLVDRIESIQQRLRGCGIKKMDVQSLAVLVDVFMRPLGHEAADQIPSGTPVAVETEDGLEEGVLVRYPGGKQVGKVHVRMLGQEAGKYRVVDADKVVASRELAAV
jgi:hypothetical protein